MISHEQRMQDAKKRLNEIRRKIGSGGPKPLPESCSTKGKWQTFDVTVPTKGRTAVKGPVKSPHDKGHSLPVD